MTTLDIIKVRRTIQVLQASYQTVSLGASVAVVWPSLNKPSQVPGLAFDSHVTIKPSAVLCAYFLTGIPNTSLRGES